MTQARTEVGGGAPCLCPTEAGQFGISLFLIGPTCVREHSWEYSANIVDS